MGTSRRVRAVCQMCCSRGQFRPLEVLVHERKCWRWYALLVCACCRLSLLSALSRGRNGSADVTRLTGSSA